MIALVQIIRTLEDKMVKTTGIPIKLSASPGAITQLPPDLGADTDVVLGEYGFSAADIAALRDAKAI